MSAAVTVHGTEMGLDQRKSRSKACVRLRFPALSAQFVPFESASERAAIAKVRFIARIRRCRVAEDFHRVLRLQVAQELLSRCNALPETDGWVLLDELAQFGAAAIADLFDHQIGLVESAQAEERERADAQKTRLGCDRRIEPGEVAQHFLETALLRHPARLIKSLRHRHLALESTRSFRERVRDAR